ncbi:TATA element modulatory factor [Maniola jurtina]|uniref:TATA element modulatory factor n=1 Tax=Maniola jurtina TaxID=191418 RepID=UPI001E688874|nr:TATA element modulatory factor [Maniola jurtina]XP_045766996.1 TATA element modulatory factor [Maniola jurtina]
MNWFDTSGLTSLAKSALKEAQKTIDKALDIQDDDNEGQDDEANVASSSKSSPGSGNVSQQDNSDFFSSWGLTVSAESANAAPIAEQPVVTESPSKSNSQSIWGSFAGSFFEQPKTDTIIRPPKAKSMNVISDKYDSQDDLFSKSQLVMSDGADCLTLKKEDVPKKDDRRNSSMSNVLSFVSSRNSSDSVEVLSQSLKSTPDSEAASCQSMSHSSSAGLKLNSESVEILPDSLVSPSSIECLGFDSYTSDKNSSSSSNLSASNLSDKKSTPIGERTEKAETADSVSLVADDDEDTMSYNSISECTAPTVLDTDDKPLSPFPKIARIEARRPNDKDLSLDQSLLVSHKMQISENSSNDGSWSDRTLNADNESITQENPAEELKLKSTEQEDVLMEKLSDSSSFYNINVSADLMRSESSAFVNVEKQQCSAPESSESSQKETSVKERISPVSSESKSDLVKIGSDRTSGHTSGDELETATSSDIEIIPSPNGDSSNGCRNSPGKYGLKQKVDGATSPNLVDLVLGKSLASKIRGHNRELSEASVQSNTSDESQGSENDRLMRRLCEMAEILDARENRLMEVSRNNAELAESNTHLKNQVESLMAKHEGGDINTITEDYTQRMSALEKKFQQVIREKDQLRKQLDSLKTEVSRKNSSEFESTLKEKEEIIAQLHEEGEKLARQELQHSNIIKKLRAKEKDNEQVIKGLRDKVAELTSELDRAKRSMAAKEEVEVNQIEAVYRLTTANKKLETELIETKSALDDTTQKLEGARTSLEAVKRELSELQRSTAELQKHRSAHAQMQASCERAEREAEMLRHELRQLRTERAKEEQRWLAREEALRREVVEAREAGEARAAGEAEAPAALLQQLAALQRGALDRERAHSAVAAGLAAQLAQAETQATKAQERERLARDEAATLAEQLAAAHRDLLEANHTVRQLSERCQTAEQSKTRCQELLDSKTQELERLRQEWETEIAALRTRVSEMETQLADTQNVLDTERKRNAILQEQVSTRGDVSPSQSIASDSFSTSFWQTEEGASMVGVGAVSGAGGLSAAGVEEALAALTRKEGERRGLAAALAAMREERAAMTDQLANLQGKLQDYQNLQEQYDALLQMYGEKEEQLNELRLDLHDVTQLYKAQLDELVALKQPAPR